MARNVIASLAAAVVILNASGAAAQTAPTQFAIAGLEAKLFYANSGRFSANILDDPKFTLWNTIIGEGSADGPSENTLLVVTVRGPGKGYADSLDLHVRATADTLTLLDRTTRIWEFNTNGNSYAACWLYDTGCIPVKIEAWLTLGDEKGPVAVKTIPFACGE